MGSLKESYNAYAWGAVNVDKQAGIKIPFADLSRIALKNCDLLFLGDTDHDNRDVRDYYSLPAAVQAYREGGAKHLFIERGPEFQPLLDNYLSKGSVPEYIDEFLKTYKLEEKRYLIDVSDPAFIQAIKMDMEWYKNFANEGFKIHSIDPHRDDEKIRPPDLSADEETLRLVTRFDVDMELSKNIRDVLPDGEKGILVLGDWHGSRAGDGLYDKHSELKTLKINVYPDRRTYEEALVSERLFNEKVDRVLPDNRLTYGEEQPDAVYFLDTGKVYLSSQAQQKFAEDIKSYTPPEVEQSPAFSVQKSFVR